MARTYEPFRDEQYISPSSPSGSLLKRLPYASLNAVSKCKGARVHRKLHYGDAFGSSVRPLYGVLGGGGGRLQSRRVGVCREGVPFAAGIGGDFGSGGATQVKALLACLQFWIFVCLIS